MVFRPESEFDRGAANRRGDGASDERASDVAVEIIEFRTELI